MFKVKLYIVPVILIYNLLSICVIAANDDVNFNLGESINEDLISKLDNDIENINLKLKNLNLDTELSNDTINKINSDNEFNKINNLESKKNNTFNNSNKKSKNYEIKWYKNNLDEHEIQKRILAQDISISPTSINLPSGNGTVKMGEKVYQAKCLSCHGTEGKAEELDQEIESLRGNANSIKIIAFDSLAGGLGSLNSEMPIRSVGSFWQHPTTLFDYIRRAMPYFEPQSLTNEEAYAVTAYVLFINNIITKDQNINAETLQKINMPNKAGFIDSWGPDWWRVWLHEKHSIFFTCFLLFGILIISLFAKKLTQNKKQINIIKILFTGIIFIWIGILNSIPLGTQKIHNSYNNLKLNNGNWENILFEPIFVILTTFVIITTLIWGRGIFCGWICPFGTIQDIIYKFKKLFNFKNFDVSNYFHNKLIYLKYIILATILISVIFTSGNNILLEFEPFKTIIEDKFNTSTILILWALLILSFSFFVERGFCRYLCPTGAALSLATKFQVINWLTTIKSCGSENCPACYPKCPTKAIKKDGTINDRECIQCLSCQIVYNDKSISCINKKNKRSIRKKDNDNQPAVGIS